MNRRLRRFPLSIGVASAFVLFALTCCESAKPTATDGQTCSLTSDCTSPLVCGFARCRAQCKTSRDCGGRLCVRGDSNTATNVCQLSTEETCTYNSGCAGNQICGPDLRCRDACATDRDCVAELVCVNRVCAKREELVNGQLPQKAPLDSGAPCIYTSDCPADLICHEGLCREQCLAEKDCAIGQVCERAPSGLRRCREGGVADGGVDSGLLPLGAPVSVVAGAFHTCALFASGVAKCWGDGTFGQLGTGDAMPRGFRADQMGNALARLDLGPGAVIASIHGDLTGSCAILKDQRVKCWGNNQHGQLGLGDNVSRGNRSGQMGAALPSIDLGSGVHATDIHIGFHACARLDDATLKCWGANGSGQLGLGDLVQRGSIPGQMGSALPTVNLGTGLTVRDVSVGYLHSCAVTSAKLVKCWGWGDTLGLEDRTDRGFAGDMGEALASVRLGAGRTVKAVRARVGHTCAILDDDSLKCWGSNETGELGQGDTASRGVVPGTMGDALLPIKLGTGRTVRAVSLGLGFTCAILDNGGVKCWGDASEGRLGLGELVPQGPRGIAPGQMGDALPYVNLGTGRTAKQITSGLAFTCVLLDNDTVKCWGANDVGQLGQGDSRTRGALNADMGDALLPVNFGVF